MLTPDTPHANWFYRQLNLLPVPQTKIAWACLLSGGTFVVIWVAMLIGREVSEGLVGTLLLFCGGLFGIASYDYKVKRTSDLDAIAAKGDADAKVAQATR